MKWQPYRELRSKVDTHKAKIVAVSKTKTRAEILELYNAGQHVFGENKVQELVPKAHSLPLDIQWHFIGHLQTNKVKQITPFITMIESVDSIKLLKEINKEAEKDNRIIPCLLQVHIAEESTKFGFNDDELKAFLDSGEWKNMNYVKLYGLMGMATYTDNKAQVQREFRHLKSLFQETKEKYFKDNHHFKEISMGMSGDYEIALEEGSTLVRIGSLIFGPRSTM